MISQPMKLLITVAIAGICLCSCLTARTSDPVACSAFNKQGDAATATFVRPKLSLQIAPAGGGKSITLLATANDDGLVSCSVFFDREHRYVAVGLIDLRLKPGPLFIVVADLAIKQIISNFSVPPSADMGVSLKLIGFFRGGPNLAVLGSGAPDHPGRSFSTTCFRVTGGQESPPEMRTLPENAESVGNINLIDAVHNRLWFQSKPEFCPLRSVPLIGSGPGAAVDEADAKAACDAVSAIGYPGEDTLITAATRDSGDLVTHVDFVHRSVAQVVLPNAGGRGSYTSVRSGVLSADGEAFAIARIVLANSSLGDAHRQGIEVDVVQVSPLKFVGRLRLKPDTDSASISIDQRNGIVKVLSFSDGRWNSEQLKPE